MPSATKPATVAGTSSCRLCGKPTKVDSQGLPIYHAACAVTAGADHGPQIGRAKR